MFGKVFLFCIAFLLSMTFTTLATAQPTYVAIQNLGQLSGDSSSYAWGINNSGNICGESSGSTETAVLWSGGVLQSLGSLGGSYSVGYGITNFNDIVGVSRNSSNQLRAFLWHAGSMQDLGTLGGSQSVASAINDNGKIVGWANTTGGGQHAFLYDNGSMSDLGTLGGGGSIANAINSNDQIAGSSDLSGGVEHAFIWTNGTMTDLGTLGGDRSQGYGINSAGKVVGLSRNGQAVEHPFLWVNNAMQDLGLITGATSGWALAINDNDQVVGTMETFSGPIGFVWQSGVLYDLNSCTIFSLPGWKIHAAVAINNNGWIVGYATNPTGQDRAILLKLIS